MRELGQVQCHQEKADISRYVFIQRAKKETSKKICYQNEFWNV